MNIGFLEISLVDIIDIALVSFLLFQVYKLIRGSVAVRVFVGFLSIYLIYLVVKASGMELLTAILGQFMGVGVIAGLILFQQEIRKFLLLVGRTTSINRENNLLFWRKDRKPDPMNVTPLVEAARSLSGSNTGALAVISRNLELKFYAESGDEIDAALNKRLLLSIFNKNSPLHDGAVIIYRNRIKAARCILPVTDQDLPPELGTRHRAAVGMSELTDTLVVVVSEETGKISIARSGRIYENISIQQLRKYIKAYMAEEERFEDETAMDIMQQTKNSADEGDFIGGAVTGSSSSKLSPKERIIKAQQED